MNKQLIENNYIVLDDFISKDLAENLYAQLKDDVKKHPLLFTKDEQCPNSFAVYDYRPFLNLLVQAVPYVSQIIGELVLPTYSYARLYKNGEILAKHTDRPSCEISISFHLGGDKDWDISFTKPNGEVISKNLIAGQGILYLGEKSEHWRNEFEGNEYGQVFLHYVLASGENWVRYFDKIG